ncbi:MAG TPA: hypothetical protein DCE42_02335 [Myxococcales bacterium]|nr:hypothetical protein [Deltaproteobacteria bacterium]MBK07324.1 hypothetical protein [Deltaproteobacteria bacterium]MBU53258.1 hypothetical protein [Deltaproteobacteria bacterium]HAA53562.1 hypothetical protein [Myxococcales bacterium]|tara:strand:+ start:16835 stop:17098 length:264 start_codon:yes stop_codon:yes gene_type:complete
MLTYTPSEKERLLSLCPFQIGERVKFKSGHDLAGKQGTITRIRPSHLIRDKLLIAVDVDDVEDDFENFGYAEHLDRIESKQPPVQTT